MDGDYKQRNVNSKKIRKEILEITNSETEVKNAFDGFICILDRSEKRISELEGMSTKISKTVYKYKNGFKNTENNI